MATYSNFFSNILQQNRPSTGLFYLYWLYPILCYIAIYILTIATSACTLFSFYYSVYYYILHTCMRVLRRKKTLINLFPFFVIYTVYLATYNMWLFFFHIYLGEQQQQQPQKGRKHKPEVNGQSSSSSCTSSSLPAVAAYQRHELTLLRMEDLLNHGSQGSSEATSAPLQNLGVSGRVQTAAELCHRMVDFCQRLTTAKRKILEDPDLYPEVRYSTSRQA